MEELSTLEQGIIERLKIYLQIPENITTMYKRWGYQTLTFPPASLAQVQLTEEKLGFRLPALIREMYLQIGNGGFGGGYGIIGVVGGYQVYDSHLGEMDYDSGELAAFLAAEEIENWYWGKGYIDYAYWGCNVTTVVDCFSPDLKVYSNDALDIKPHSSLTLHQWWLDFLDDRLQQY